MRRSGQGLSEILYKVSLIGNTCVKNRVLMDNSSIIKVKLLSEKSLHFVLKNVTNCL